MDSTKVISYLAHHGIPDNWYQKNWTLHNKTYPLVLYVCAFSEDVSRITLGGRTLVEDPYLTLEDLRFVLYTVADEYQLKARLSVRTTDPLAPEVS